MEFSNRTRTGLLALMRWRRDVRHFRDDPVPEALQDHLQKAMALAPSVGNARPWRVFRGESPDARQQVHAIFARANAAAALSSLRAVVRGIAPQVLQDEGLVTQVDTPDGSAWIVPFDKVCADHVRLSQIVAA